jgi:3-oxoacyl-[acyl-carrier protein] reductase
MAKLETVTATDPGLAETTLTVLLAGGSSPAGVAAARALSHAGFRVLSVGSDAGRIAAAIDGIPSASALACDLAEPAEVAALAAVVHRDFGRIDGLVHLVGGWRGGAGIAGQTDADWDFLHHRIVSTLRNTSRAFYDDLVASPAGRLAIVSSTSVIRPTADNANYAAVKSAAEAWTQAVANGFAADGSNAAAVILAVKGLVDGAMRAASPERTFPGFTDVTVLAGEICALFTQPAASVNGCRKILQ